MAYTVTGLADYVKGTPEVIITDIVLGTKTGDHYSIQEGVKYQDKFIDVNTPSVDVSDGDYGTYSTTSGGVSLSDVTIENTQLFFNIPFSKASLNKKLAEVAGKKGSSADEFIYGDVISKLLVETLNYDNDIKIWQSVDGSTSVAEQLRFFDGILIQLAKGAPVSGGTSVNFVTDAGITDASILTKINALIAKKDASLGNLANTALNMSMAPAQFNAYKKALFGLNGTILSTTLQNGQVMESFICPVDETITVWKEAGLTGKNQVVLTRPENICVAVDLKSEDETVEIWYNQAAHRYEIFGVFKLGVKVIRTNEVVMLT